MNITPQSNVGQIVAENYRYAGVFRAAGIDFCCKGNHSIQHACEQSNLNVDDLIAQLKEVEATPAQTEEQDYNSWPLDLLADYIEKTHHRYVRHRIEEITPYLDKIMRVHGGRHPELVDINELFSESAKELVEHMDKEESGLFPQIRKLVDSKKGSAQDSSSVEVPIASMHHDHDAVGERFHKMSVLSDKYTPPPDACNTYMVTYSLLKEFEDDLFRHIHLENNILFPKSIVLEQDLNSAAPVA
ncbi:MAG: iron-sulfur cluster repair di-iron protein [Armatimonadetes bacterium]|nr:iron-sulfur cluster repair di-iron protein [Armatimonadota bacterium]